VAVRTCPGYAVEPDKEVLDVAEAAEPIVERARDAARDYAEAHEWWREYLEEDILVNEDPLYEGWLRDELKKWRTRRVGYAEAIETVFSVEHDGKVNSEELISELSDESTRYHEAGMRNRHHAFSRALSEVEEVADCETIDLAEAGAGEVV
jgi:hypothetical protein